MDWKLPTLAAMLWVIAFTVVGAGLGLLIGPVGPVIGAIPLALGTVLAGYVPAIRDAAQRRRVAQQKWDEIGEPATETVDGGPVGLLRPDRAIVQFTGRETELRALREWCASEDARSVRTIVGAGGVGKTRLALKVASEWESRGDEWRRVDAGWEAEAVAAARGVTPGPVLLVVDYAETRTDLEAMLKAVLADSGPIRVLLVARSLGEWWEQLIEKSASAIGQLLTEAEPIPLAEQIIQETSDAELVADAIPQFARAVKCASPEHAEFELPAHPVPVLVLHTAALVAALRFRDDPAASLRVVVAEGVLDELLVHEARYWRRKAAAAGLPAEGALLKPVVAVAALLGARALAEAADLIARVPDLSDTSQEQRRSWARWLYELYPPDREGQLGSLQPDLLAETHVVRQLVAAPDLAQACLRNLSRDQAVHALTVLARARVHQDAAQQLIAEALQEDLAHLAVPTAQVALQTSGALSTLLADALREAPAPLGALIRIADTLPYPSVTLAQAHLQVVLRVREALPPGAKPAVIAEWNRKTGAVLVQLGRAPDAVPVTEEAIAIYRELAQGNPAQYGHDLAMSLVTLGAILSELGRSADALLVTEEAVAIYRELAQGNPARYRHELAESLSNLGLNLSEMGRAADALPVIEEAIAIYRELARGNPARYSPGLAVSLTNLSFSLLRLGRHVDALKAAQEAVATYRQLVQIEPDRYRPGLAQSLSNLGVGFSELGRHTDAVAPRVEAVAVRRALAQVNPARYGSDLAVSLTSLGTTLSELGRHTDAVAPRVEAVAVRRALAQVNPARYRSGLAVSLTSLGTTLSELGRHSEALHAWQEAVGNYRELVQSAPSRYRSHLARSLSNLGASFPALDRYADALPVLDEAIAIYRQLAQADPERYRPTLVAPLATLGAILFALDRDADALPVIDEAIAINRQLAQADPERYRADISQALDMMAANLAAPDQQPEEGQIHERPSMNELQQDGHTPAQSPSSEEQ